MTNVNLEKFLIKHCIKIIQLGYVRKNNGQ